MYKVLCKLLIPAVFLTSFSLTKLTQNESIWMGFSHFQQNILQDLLAVTLSVPGSTHWK